MTATTQAQLEQVHTKIIHRFAHGPALTLDAINALMSHNPNAVNAPQEENAAFCEAYKLRVVRAKWAEMRAEVGIACNPEKEIVCDVNGKIVRASF